MEAMTGVSPDFSGVRSKPKGKVEGSFFLVVLAPTEPIEKPREWGPLHS
jgi:hypothetical protein